MHTGSCQNMRFLLRAVGNVKNLKSTERGGGKVLGVEQVGGQQALELLTKDSGAKFGDVFCFLQGTACT